MNVSIVSTSRVAAPPHFGHVVFTNSATSASGERPFGIQFVTVSGRSTGSCSFGTGTTPHAPQCTIGIGAPQ
ncbi:hypothetical protein D3C83_119100 [compost metagenome]